MRIAMRYCPAVLVRDGHSSVKFSLGLRQIRSVPTMEDGRATRPCLQVRGIDRVLVSLPRVAVPVPVHQCLWAADNSLKLHLFSGGADCGWAATASDVRPIG